jgi:hypothetical protein
MGKYQSSTGPVIIRRIIPIVLLIFLHRDKPSISEQRDTDSIRDVGKRSRGKVSPDLSRLRILLRDAE